MNPRRMDTKESAGPIASSVETGLLSEDGGTVRRERTAFTNSQVLELEKEFLLSPYLCRSRRMDMAKGLQLTDRQVKIWFQNRRTRYKKERKNRGVARPSCLVTRGPCFIMSSSSDHLGFSGKPVVRTLTSSLRSPLLDAHSGANNHVFPVNPVGFPTLNNIPLCVADGRQSFSVDSNHYLANNLKQSPVPNNSQPCIYLNQNLIDNSSHTYTYNTDRCDFNMVKSKFLQLQ